jgi:hypothetical protein
MRFVHRLVERGVARVYPLTRDRWSHKTPGFCHIFGVALYRALGSREIRHRRLPGGDLLWARLLSLDAVIEEPDRPWLPDERDKVRWCDELGIPRAALPSKIYRGREAETVRFFAPWKLPIAGAADRATFVYADPGRESGTELSRWAAEHTPLWAALRDRAVRVDVAVVARNHSSASRAYRWLEARSGAPGVAWTPEDEERWERLDRALRSRDPELLEAEGGFMAVVRAHGAMMRTRRAWGGFPIDTFTTRVATRVAGDGYGP